MIAILIVVSWKGHHPLWCSQYIRACAPFSRRIYVICPDEVNPLNGLEKPDALFEKISVLHFSNNSSKTGFKNFGDLKSDFRELRTLVTSIEESNPGEKLFIFHTSLDCLFIGVSTLPLLALNIRRLFPWPFSGMLMSPDRRWPLQGARRLIERFFNRNQEITAPVGFLKSIMDGALQLTGNLLRACYLWQRNLVLKRSRCEQILVLDERYQQWLSRKTGKRILEFPDTTFTGVSETPSPIVQMIAEKKQGQVVVGLLGEMSRRKGTDLLLDVIQKHDTKGLLFVIAGTCDSTAFSPDQRAFLEEGIYKKDNVIYSPETVPSEEDFNAIIESCDIIYCVYRDHLHSSGIISKAVAFRKPVLVSEGQLMAKRVRDYGIGVVLPEQTPTACLKALQQLSATDYREGILRAGKFERYSKDHSFERYQQIMSTLIKGSSI